MRNIFDTQLLFDICFNELKNDPTRACNGTDQMEHAYYDVVCKADITNYLFSFFWIIVITVVQIILSIFFRVRAHRNGRQYPLFQNFKKSIFYKILREGEAPQKIWKSEAFQYFLYFTISLGYYYWVPLENVFEATLFETTENGKGTFWKYFFISIVGMVCEFFYFWITFFIILMLGTRWEYTIYNRVEHVSSTDKTPMLIFMLKKSVIMSSLFTVVRLMLLILFRKPMVSTYNHPVANIAAFRLYRIFRSVYIFIYGWQRLIRYKARLQKLKIRRKNETLDLEIRHLTQKYQKDVISSIDNLQLILNNTEKDEPQLVQRFENNVQEYFHSQKEELEEKIRVIKAQDVNTLQRNPKEIPFLGGIYLFVTVASYFAYAVAYISNEICQTFNEDDCNCASPRHAVEIIKVIILIIDLVPTSVIIQFLLRYDSLFGDTVELNVRHVGG